MSIICCYCWWFLFFHSLGGPQKQFANILPGYLFWIGTELDWRQKYLIFCEVWCTLMGVIPKFVGIFLQNASSTMKDGKSGKSEVALTPDYKPPPLPFTLNVYIVYPVWVYTNLHTLCCTSSVRHAEWRKQVFLRVLHICYSVNICWFNGPDRQLLNCI